MGYLMDIFWALMTTLGQITFALTACYFLYKSMKGIKPISQALTVDAAFVAWLKQACMTGGMFISMILCSIDVITLGIVMLCAAVALAMLGLGVLQFRLVKRRLLGEPSANMQQHEGGEVLVQRLQPNRIRGMSDQQEPVIFTDADLGRFEAVRGRVRMLNVGFAMRMVNGASILPVMAFFNDDGDSFLIYKDDFVVPV